MSRRTRRAPRRLGLPGAAIYSPGIARSPESFLAWIDRMRSRAWGAPPSGMPG